MRRFPTVSARDLEGTDRLLPDDLGGERNVALIAFRRHHQAAVDSWVPWLEEQAADDPDLRFYELPTIGTRWSPVRPMIDGGMATAIRTPAVLARTWTIYTDVRRITTPLGITDTDDIAVVLLGRDGLVRWQCSGAFEPGRAGRLGDAIEAMRHGASDDRAHDDATAGRQFDFAFAPAHRPLLAALCIVPSTAHVTVTDDELIARFGPWCCRTPRTNVRDVATSGPYRAHRAIGVRLSFADHGLTFGSTTAGGVCIRFHEPVGGLVPRVDHLHPGLTVTVADPDGLVAALDDARRVGD